MVHPDIFLAIYYYIYPVYPNRNQKITSEGEQTQTVDGSEAFNQDCISIFKRPPSLTTFFIKRIYVHGLFKSNFYVRTKVKLHWLTS